jgi:hypothetical protein
MRRIIGITLIFVFLFKAFVFAQISVKAEVDKKSITTDENITYKITITSTQKDIPEPKIPEFKGFNIVSSAQSSTVSFVESGIKAMLVYAFILSPTDTGKLKIEPVIIKIKNETYSSDTLEIEVRQGKTQPKPKPEQKPSLPEESQPEPESEPAQTTL